MSQERNHIHSWIHFIYLNLKKEKSYFDSFQDDVIPHEQCTNAMKEFEKATHA